MRLVEQNEHHLILNIGNVWLYSSIGSALGVLGLVLIFFPGLLLGTTGIISLLIGGFMVLVSAGVIALAQSATFNFNKQDGVLKIMREGLMTGSVQEYDLATFEGIDADSNGQRYRIVLSGATGQELPLSSGFTLSEEQAADLTEKLRTFLDLP